VNTRLILSVLRMRRGPFSVQRLRSNGDGRRCIRVPKHRMHLFENLVITDIGTRSKRRPQSSKDAVYVADRDQPAQCLLVHDAESRSLQRSAQ
jgi:hypothetical protein